MSIHNSTRRIVFLSDLNSPEIEQAIFILRDNVSLSKADAVEEAQRIVNAYLEEINPQLFSYRKKEKQKKFILPATFMALLTVFTVLAINLLR